MSCTTTISAASLSSTNLESLTLDELEQFKTHLITLRSQVLDLQNARAPLLRLPGEIRNMIFTLALDGSVRERRRCRQYGRLFREPALLATCRQVRGEALGAWHAEVLVWEEYDAKMGAWQVLAEEDIRDMLRAKDSAGRRQLVTQPSHCCLTRTRDAVMQSKSVCPRMGLVRSRYGEATFPQMRWWVREC